jgi:hypothetical protein
MPLLSNAWSISNPALNNEHIDEEEIVPGLGSPSIFAGVGLFASSIDKKRNTTSDESLSDSTPLTY